MNMRNLPKIALFAVCAGVFAAASLPALLDDEGFPRGDILVAERYVVWAEQAIADGRMAQAQATLERANDFADVSSDVSYLLASVRARNGESRFLVLEALEKAIGVNQWRRYSEAEALLLQAEHLIALRRFYAALNSLDIYRFLASETIDSALLRMQALSGLALAGMDFPPTNMPTNMPMGSIGHVGVMPGVRPPAALEFRQQTLETMDRNPLDPQPLRILFSYASQRLPNADDLALVEIALRRLPFLLDADPGLAWMAAPFVGDLEEARRLVMAYRAGDRRPGAAFAPNPASIVPALNLGLLDDIDAVEELFAAPAQGELALDKGLLAAVGDLLRSDEGRDRFAERLHSFTGAITSDENRDGIPESRAVFQDGVLLAFYHDADQDGVPDWSIAFDAGLPQRGEFLAMPEASRSSGSVSGGDRVVQALIVWYRYPLVQQVILREETFFFPPGNFQYNPIAFANFGASETYEGLLIPARNHLSQGLTRRALAMSAATIERPSLEFEGGAERVYLRQGIPVFSQVTADGMVISATEFENGFPVIQRVDLTREGRLQTIRLFHPGTNTLRSSASDWRGDGIFEYADLYQ